MTKARQIAGILAASIVVATYAARCQAASVEISTTDGTGGISGQLRRSDASAFGGTQWHIKNDGSSSGNTRKGYLRFDTSGIGLTAKYAALDLTVSLITNSIADVDQTIYVYGITNQSLDNVVLTNNLPWADGPANDAASAYEADLTKAELLGTFMLDATGDKAAPEGTVIRFSNKALTDFIKADTNGLVTLMFGRIAGSHDQDNLLFAGETHATYDPPKLIVDDLPISLVNTGSYWSSVDAGSFTKSFAAGAADKLILSSHHESTGTIASITYSGVPLTPIPGGNKRLSLWYLDNPYTGGVANIIVTMNGTGRQMGLGVASIAGSIDGYQEVAAANNTNSVDLTISTDNSFVFAAFGVNQATSVDVMTPPLGRIAIIGDDSMAADAGYQNRVSAATHTYSCTAVGTPLTYYATAVSFGVYVETQRGTMFVFE